MNKHGRVSNWIAAIALGSFGLGLLGLISMAVSGPGQGEVGVILHGAFMGMFTIFCAVTLFLACWGWFWHVKWLRIMGFLVLVLALIGSFVGPRLQMAYHNYNYAQKQKDSAELTAVRDAAYDQLRSSFDDTDAALAVANTFDAAVADIQFRRLIHTGPRDVFHRVHEIYMSVFHEHALPEFEERGVPYDPALCTRFGEQFQSYLATIAQRDRGRNICPEGY